MASKSTLDKVKALSTFVQHEVRYVAIEIGVGGYQPHRAFRVLPIATGTARTKSRCSVRYSKRLASILTTCW